MNFDYCIKCTQNPAPLTREGFEALIRQPWLQTMADEIAGGNIKRKRDLPAACWQASYGGQKRSNATAVPSGLFALDIDHVEDPKALFEGFRERIPELGIYIVHKTPSTRGLRIVAACREGLSSIGENQEWLSGELGIQHDAVTRDFARLSFLVPESYFYHYDAALFTDEPKVLLQSTANLRLRPQVTQSTGLQPAQGGVPVNPSAGKTGFADFPHGYSDTAFQAERLRLEAATMSNRDHRSEAEMVTVWEALPSDAAGGRYSEAVSNPVRSAGCTNSPNQTCLEGSTYPTDYDGIPYPLLVECLAEQLGGVPVHGSRNNFIFSMACHLRYVCNDDPQWIRQVLPTYGEAPERVNPTIQSACNRAQSRNVPALVQRAISIARGQVASTRLVSQSNQNPISAAEPPALPKRLPKLIQLLVSKVDPMYRPAVAMAVFPPLGAHLHGVTARYIDNSENDLGGFMSVCMAKQSIGKGSVNMPIELIMEDVRQRDSFSRDQEKQWKTQCKQAKASEKKPVRPDGLCVQYLMSNMTNAAMVQRLIDAQGAGDKFLYVKLDEIELLDQIRATGGATASELIRLAFTQSLYGQERVGQDSVTGTPPLRFNFNASTTIPSGMSYFRNGLTNGTLSRVTFSTIIKPMGRRGIPRFGDYDESFRRALAPFITNLNAATGLIECRQAERLANQLMEENYDLAELSDDDVFETLSYRANRIAYDKAMLLFIAHGYQWSREIADFCRWSEQYDLWCKLHFFGQSMREQVRIETMPTVFGPQNMLDLLPDRFSRQDLQAVHRAQGKDGNVMQLIYNWTFRNYIEQDEATSEYIKTETYLSKHKRVLS